MTVEECVNAVGYSIIPIITYDTEKEILDINDYEPDVYQNSTYKKVYYCQEVYNVNPNGYQFRSNVSGRSTIYQLSRLSTWEIKAQNRKNNKSPIKSKFIENKQIDTESLKCVFDIAQKDKLISTIDSFMKHNSYASPFIDEVTEEISSDYQNVIAVQMNLNCIITNLENEKYRSKEMLMFDLKQIELNCIEYNGADSNFSKDAHKLYENLKKQLEQFSSYRLRSVSHRSALSDI